jgi:FkbM family methyltransferase
MEILYGANNTYIDITGTVFKKCLTDTGIVIPSGDDLRAQLFTDPYIGILKHIIIKYNNNEYVFHSNNEISITFPSISEQLNNLNNFTNLKYWWDNKGKFIIDTSQKLGELHSRVKLKYGNIKDELVEQFMAITNLNENAKVLELGSNVGRNTIIISTILKDSKNLVTLESDPDIANQLCENLQLNNISTNIEASALSSTRLIQKGWYTVPLEEGIPITDDWKEISTITYDELMKKYNIAFDTLVADCEGALFYILRDYPQLLDNMNLLIIENDYNEIENKQFVDSVFISKGFKRTFVYKGGWGPCSDVFWEVWKKE